MTVQEQSSRTAQELAGQPDEGLAAIPEEKLDVRSERFYYAKQWELIWWRFRRHRLAMISLVLLIILYLIAIMPGFASPYLPQSRFEGRQQSPPTKVHMIDENGGIHLPFVYALSRELDQKTFKYIYTEDTSQRYPIKLFVKGEPYKFWGLFETSRHLFGVGVD